MRDYSRSELETAINEWIVGKNAQRDRMILKSRLIDGLTFDALAELYDMSPRQIKRIVYKSQETLFRHL
jgi:DNA-directed RNA polymerase specialized sigma subunit